MSGLEILSIAPSATVQDRGRQGFLRYGVTGGGAMDVFALSEGQALLKNGADDAAIEFADYGGRFRAAEPMWVATSGAEMRLSLNGSPVDWRRTHFLERGDVLDVGSAIGGIYGYLHVCGGFLTEVVLGARSTHLRAGFGHVLQAGQVLQIGSSKRDAGQVGLPQNSYMKKRDIRVMWGPQSQYFSNTVRDRFAASVFEVTRMRDRMGVQVVPDMGAVKSAEGLTIASDAINLGDIQVTGDGTPAVLLADRGPSGGYPRIGTVITADIAALAQIPTGEKFKLRVVSRKEAVLALASFRKEIAGLSGRCLPLVRDPRDMDDLLAYNLVDGVLKGDEYDGD